MKFADHPKRDEVVAELTKWASCHPEVMRIIVYGSRARGQQRPDSDLDVAVELRSSSTGDIPLAIWIDEKDEWSEELHPNLPWPLHLEWNDPQGLTPTVAAKIAKGYYVAFERGVSKKG